MVAYEGTNSKVESHNSERFGKWSSSGSENGAYPKFQKMWNKHGELKTEVLMFNANRHGWEVPNKHKNTGIS